MEFYVNTRSYTEDYAWLISSPKEWWREYSGYFRSEKPALIIKKDNNEIKIYLTAIPSSRKDKVKTPIRYTLAINVDSEETEYINNIKIIVTAWLYERFNSKNNVMSIADSQIGNYLDKIFTEETVAGIFNNQINEIPPDIEKLNIFADSCKNEESKIEFETIEKSIINKQHIVCDLKAGGIGYFASFVKDIFADNPQNNINTIAFFNSIPKINNIVSYINDRKSFPDLVCCEFNAINDNDNEAEKIKDGVYVLDKFIAEKLPQETPNTQKKTEVADTTKQTEISQETKIQIQESQKPKANTATITIVVLLIISNIATLTIMINQSVKIKLLDLENKQKQTKSEVLEEELNQTQTKLQKNLANLKNLEQELSKAQARIIQLEKQNKLEQKKQKELEQKLEKTEKQNQAIQENKTKTMKNDKN